MSTRTTDVAGPLSHRSRWRAGVVQSLPPAGFTELGPGYLDPDLVPVDLLGEAYARALAGFGSAALAYGDNQGELGLREELAARAGGCGPEHVLVTAGTSHSLYLLATMTAAPGDAVVVEQTGYDFGRSILADCGLRPVEVAADDEGMDPAALAEALAGRDVRFVYLNPTFHNPTGVVVPRARREELLAVARRYGVLVVEDDAYADLPLEPGERESMASLAGYRGVVRLGTVSKTLGPGLRFGWMTGDPALIARLVGHGLFVSGGSANHLASLAVGELLRSGEYDRHLGWLRDRLRERRDALAAALTGAARFRLPRGGCFLWLTGHDEDHLLAAAHRARVNVAAGSRFGSPAVPGIRLSYSFASPRELAVAGAALAGEIGRDHDPR